MIINQLISEALDNLAAHVHCAEADITLPDNLNLYRTIQGGNVLYDKPNGDREWFLNGEQIAHYHSYGHLNYSIYNKNLMHKAPLDQYNDHLKVWSFIT